jgi:hypothetical protein
MVGMTAIDPPRPRSRPFWGDARFLLGVLLVAVSVAGVWLVVSAARQTVPMLVAADTLVPGAPIAEGDVRVVDVALGAADRAYLAPEALAEGVVATRTVGEGELVPADAVGPAASAGVTTVVIDTAVAVPASVSAGAAVEVWFAPPTEEAGVFETPRILVPDATVVSVAADDAVVGRAGASLEVVIPREDVPAVLAATANGSTLSVVPAAGVSG